MLFLTATTDSIAVTTSNGAAYDVDIVSTFIDRVTSTGVIGEAQRELENMASATTVDIVEEPASDTTRKVKSIHIRNTHATSAVDVLVQLDANGTFYELHKATLLAGESLCYLDTIGFFKLVDTTRLERSFVTESSQAITSVTPTFVDITDLTCPMKSGVVYGVLACIQHISSGTTIGCQLGFNIGAAPTASRFGTIDTVTASTTASVHSAGSITARDTAITAQTTGSAAVSLAIIAGFIQPSADGTFAMRGCVDQAGTLTIQAGSWLRVFRPTG